jgi:hypothetical protein
MLHETEVQHSESGYGHECSEIEHRAFKDHEMCVMLFDLRVVQDDA